MLILKEDKRLRLSYALIEKLPKIVDFMSSQFKEGVKVINFEDEGAMNLKIPSIKLNLSLDFINLCHKDHSKAPGEFYLEYIEAKVYGYDRAVDEFFDLNEIDVNFLSKFDLNYLELFFNSISEKKTLAYMLNSLKKVSLKPSKLKKMIATFSQYLIRNEVAFFNFNKADVFVFLDRYKDLIPTETFKIIIKKGLISYITKFFYDKNAKTFEYILKYINCVDSETEILLGKMVLYEIRKIGKKKYSIYDLISFLKIVGRVESEFINKRVSKNLKTALTQYEEYGRNCVYSFDDREKNLLALFSKLGLPSLNDLNAIIHNCLIENLSKLGLVGYDLDHSNHRELIEKSISKGYQLITHALETENKFLIEKIEQLTHIVVVVLFTKDYQTEYNNTFLEEQFLEYEKYINAQTPAIMNWHKEHIYNDLKKIYP